MSAKCINVYLGGMCMCRVLKTEYSSQVCKIWEEIDVIKI